MQDSVLRGNAATNGGGGLYCVFGSRVSRCTLEGNRAGTGGGFLGAFNSLVEYSTLTSNKASGMGGGAYMFIGSLHNCLLVGNSAGSSGGGAFTFIGNAVNCTVAYNTAGTNGGGLGFFAGHAVNSIVISNTAPISPNYSAINYWTAMSYSCTDPVFGGNCITTNPQFVSPSTGNYRLKPGSPCINAGINQDWMTNAIELDGKPRVINGTVDMGAYEWTWTVSASAGAHGTISPAGDSWVLAGSNITYAIVADAHYHITNVVVDGVSIGATNAYAFTGVSSNHTIVATFAIDTYPVTATAGAHGAISPSGVVQVAYGTDALFMVQPGPGYAVSNVVVDGVPQGALSSYEFENVTNAHAIQASFMLAYHPAVYVTTNGGAVFPYTNWVTAATNLVEALGAASDGTVVSVSGGVYKASSPVSITVGAHLRAVNGPTATCIDGRGVDRGVLIQHTNAILDGFTVSNGVTATTGGGIYVGVAGGTIRGCRVTGCQANYGAGVFFAAGGGMLERSVVDGNTMAGAQQQGGGIYVRQGVSARNCVVMGNRAKQGGGVYLYQGGRLDNCTIVTNAAELLGGGVQCDNGGIFDNTIVYYNSRFNGLVDNVANSGSGMAYTNCCTTPVQGVGCVTNAPGFVDSAAGNYRPATGSRCINAGTNRLWMVGGLDADGGPRIVNSVVDIGAYEYSPVHFVSLSGGHVTPFTRWEDAATNIQSAVDVASPGDTVWVTNGTYRPTVEVSIVRPITVTSVNGESVTRVDGGGVHRVAALSGGGVLQGFTVTNGYGVGHGAGLMVDGGTVRECVVTDNRTAVGGHYGGGLFLNGASLAERCVVRSNWAGNQGGGAWVGNGATLRNCLVTDNGSGDQAGGVFCYVGATVESCTIVGNAAVASAGGILCYTPGGQSASTVRNSLVLCNTGATSNHTVNGASFWEDCCTMPALGSGCVSSDPLLVNDAGGDYRLGVGSPCWNAGTNQSWMGAGSDLDGVDRVLFGRVDIGAYEYSPATTYVSLEGSNAAPYDTWARAARAPKDAVNAVKVGGWVLITNGIYEMTKALVLSKAVTVKGVNGRESVSLVATKGDRCIKVDDADVVIEGLTLSGGYGDNLGGGIYVTVAGGVIRGCRITGCHAEYGAGVFFGASGGLIENCVVDDNHSDLGSNWQAGGIYLREGVTARGCLVFSNSAMQGGGVYAYLGGRLENCTVSGNTALNEGGGLFAIGPVAAESSIFYFNTSDGGANYFGGIFTDCCATPLPPDGEGNIEDDPLFVNRLGGDYRLGRASRCVNAGTNRAWMVSAVDLDGTPRIQAGVVDIGAYEDTPTHYVSGAGGHIWPFSSWTAAATNLTAALAVARGGDTVLISNGVHTVVSEIVVSNAVTIRGMAGAGATVFDGGYATRCFVLSDSNAVLECLTIQYGSASSAASPAGRGGAVYGMNGGVLRDCIVVSNRAVAVSEGSSLACGGGVYFGSGGVMDRCVVRGNQAMASSSSMMPMGGGTAQAFGGGVYAPSAGLTNCVIEANIAQAMAEYGMSMGIGQAEAVGGGLWMESGLMRGGLVVDNRGYASANGIAGSSAVARVGGVRSNGGLVESCTIVSNRVTGNSSMGPPTLEGGGVYGGGRRLNTIAYFNAASSGPNFAGSGASFTNSCITPLPGSGTGNTTNDPRFASVAARDFRLDTASPCFNTGTNQVWMAGAVDLNGLGRIQFGVVDMGAYEYRPGSTYAALNGGNTMPYDTWNRAATNIQTAVDAAASGGTVWVSNGLHQLAGPITITQGITVRGKNGYSGTTVSGRGVVRCFELNHADAVIEGLMVYGGYNATSGGGINVGVPGGVIRNCWIYGCRSQYGGGVYFASNGGVIENCLLQTNQATVGNSQGGGVYVRQGVTVRNCTLAENVATRGGGLYAADGGAVINTILYGNQATSVGSNVHYWAGAASYEFSCVAPLQAGAGNTDANPQFIGVGNYHLTEGSPCVNSGTNGGAPPGNDLDDMPRVLGWTVDMGCYEFNGSPVVDVTTPATNVAGGESSFAVWGTNNAWVAGVMRVTNTANGGTATFPAAMQWVAPSLPLAYGINLIRVYGTNRFGVSANDGVVVTRQSPLTTYVATNGANIEPYDLWSRAATNMQVAVDVVGDGGTVWVSNGIYRVGTAVSLGKALTLQSVNGKAVTAVDGGGVTPVFVIGHTNAEVCGFTVTNGYNMDQGGGIVFSVAGGVARQCRITKGRSMFGGGGVSFDAAGGMIEGCVIDGNTTDNNGGGVWMRSGAVMRNCLLYGNIGGYDGGAVYCDRGGLIQNCTFTGNLSVRGGGVYGYQGGIVENSIMYANSSIGSGTNWYADGAGLSVTYSCTWPNPGGAGNLTNGPQFVNASAANYAVRYGSVCIDAGTNLVAVTNDVSGYWRPLDGNWDGQVRHDIGAHEYNQGCADSSGDGIPDWWCRVYQFDPVATNTPDGNPDQDLHTTAQEWVADTNPTNGLSYFKLTGMTGSNGVAEVRFVSSSNRVYTLYRATNLVQAAWTNIAGRSRIPGIGGADRLTDTNGAPSRGYYRVSVEVP